MTTSGAQAVLDRMEADEAFAQRVKDAGGPEASLSLLGVEGFEVTQQELRDAVLDRYSDALTAEQAEAIAGGYYPHAVGTFEETPAPYIVMGTIGVAAVAAGGAAV